MGAERSRGIQLTLINQVDEVFATPFSWIHPVQTFADLQPVLAVNRQIVPINGSGFRKTFQIAQRRPVTR